MKEPSAKKETTKSPNAYGGSIGNATLHKLPSASHLSPLTGRSKIHSIHEDIAQSKPGVAWVRPNQSEELKGLP